MKRVQSFVKVPSTGGVLSKDFELITAFSRVNHGNRSYRACTRARHPLGRAPPDTGVGEGREKNFGGPDAAVPIEL